MLLQERVRVCMASRRREEEAGKNLPESWGQLFVVGSCRPAALPAASLKRPRHHGLQVNIFQTHRNSRYHRLVYKIHVVSGTKVIILSPGMQPVGHGAARSSNIQKRQQTPKPLSIIIANKPAGNSISLVLQVGIQAIVCSFC